MKAQTRYFGTINYEKEDILYFPNGLFGFENQTNYLLIRIEDDNNLLLCMQSLEDTHLTFILTNPFHYLPDYSPKLMKEDLEALELSDNSSVTFYAICVIHEDIKNSTINLKCPIAINPVTRVARQIILEDSSYTFRHSLKELSNSQKEGISC